jgi:hypothetical protein
VCLVLCSAIPQLPFAAQETPQDTNDLQVELRSATGSNRFQIGEQIPLEAVFSSGAANRYLEPCKLFDESHFGYPRCRFRNEWSFSILPKDGWIDLTKEFPAGPMMWSGPSYDVPSHDLGSAPAKFSYMLTNTYRFDEPGKYTVRLSMQVGLDDDSTQWRSQQADSPLPHFVSITREFTLQIVPASSEWQKEIIRKGYEAFTSPIPAYSKTPSPEFLERQKNTEALCNMATPDAVRVLATLLSKNDKQEVEVCLEESPRRVVVLEEMLRLQMDPDTAVTPGFLKVVCELQSKVEAKEHGNSILMIHGKVEEQERDTLFAALQKKRGEAQITSLATFLGSPQQGLVSLPKPPYVIAYDLPFPPAVVSFVAKNFGDLPMKSKEMLLGRKWKLIRSPLMLPAVRHEAEVGNGQALVRWFELDPTAATDFARGEIIRPAPRFSSFSLQLSNILPPEQERQLASNFVALAREQHSSDEKIQGLGNAATLLHRYATRNVLPIVLPVVNGGLNEWPCQAQIATLAYLLKVSPQKDAPQLEKILEQGKDGSCGRWFFTEMGFLQPSPLVEEIAVNQIDKGGDLGVNAATYIQIYGSARMKPVVWNQLKRWYEKPGAGHRSESIVWALLDAYVGAQSWTITPEESRDLETLIGAEDMKTLECRFGCGRPLTFVVPGTSSTYFVERDEYDAESNTPELFDSVTHPMEFHNAGESVVYTVDRQYKCSGLNALKEKLLQFPTGSTFNITANFSPLDHDEKNKIDYFLRNHGYKVSHSTD